MSCICKYWRRSPVKIEGKATGKMRTGGRVNCGPSLRTADPCVGIGKTLYSERLMPRNYGGTLTGEDVVCIPCINGYKSRCNDT